MPNDTKKSWASKFKHIGQIALDTAVFIYHFEANPKYHNLTLQLFSLIEKGLVQASASILVHSEVLVKPMRLGSVEFVTAYEAHLLHGPKSFTLVPLTPEVSRQAAFLRAIYGFALVDAIHVASALAANAKLFITNDRQLTQIRELPVLILDDYV
ncbi:MAG: PIN domain-containing protein [Patescibacteria group bacterium]